MKKNLFTCFLALLCLAGSAALSQVVQSPRADLLHRFGGPTVSLHSGDTHRGGIARPDTFPPGTLYIEVTHAEGVDSLSLRFWEHLVSERMNVTPGQPLRRATLEGNMFEGNRNFRVAEIPFPSAESFGYFNVSYGRNRLIRQWIYFPQDRVRIRGDLSSGFLLFGGPDGDFYRLQHEVDRVFKEEEFNTDPILFSPDAEFYRSDSVSERLWNQSRIRPEDLFVQMRLITDAESAWGEVESYISSSWQDHPAMAILDRYSGLLASGRLDLVEAAIKGQVLATGIKKAELAWPAIRQDPSKLAGLREWVETFGLKGQEFSHPLLVQAYYQYALMESHATQVPIEQVYAPLPNPLREEVIAFYILDNFNRMEDRLPSVISQNLPLVESDWIRQRFDGLLSNAGGQFSSDGIYLPDGSQLSPPMLEGKTVLIHFWISGCRFCLEEHQRVMAQLSERYRGSEDILVLTVNADASPESWKQSLATGKYTSESALNAWGPRGTGILESYSIYSYPQKMIISKDGTVRLQTILRMEPEELIRRLEQDAAPDAALLNLPNPY
ncbi:TlpA disulfide reductase family protein [Algoriphagus sp. A40]|uniref:TlpA family protein disulfide reductase n=1 Tax=Algoriphagus sp. A40 TaxID=1945863 RepID=UPI000986640B|nr:TlpA disulfide reductase family protein [Algoriphagus sp. A40]OOG76447.1 hypothetical protein B0E43_08120 [Algoriphagus sp. A40]